MSSYWVFFFFFFLLTTEIKTLLSSLTELPGAMVINVCGKVFVSHSSESRSAMLCHQFLWNGGWDKELDEAKHIPCDCGQLKLPAYSVFTHVK